MKRKTLVTINADAGEGFGLWKFGDEEKLFRSVDLVNVACGFHASDPSTMEKTVRLAKRKGLKVGAHPSFKDKEGFGRREMKITSKEVFNIICYQVGALNVFLKNEGMKLNHIKPHGSLYGVTSRDPEKCGALLDAVELFKVPLLGMPGSLHETMCKTRGIEFIGEFFVDLEYDKNGKLIITRKHGKVEVSKAAARLKRALEKGKVLSSNGKVELSIKFDSVCVHSDTERSLEIAKAAKSVVKEYNSKYCVQPKPLGTLLVANRGEIACRIIRCCKKMGLKSISIFTDVDENSSHVFQADVAIALPKGSDYTSIDAILKICKENNVQMIHPGYGFLSEHSEFCKKLEENGIIFLGPTFQNIEQFGLKHAARALAEKAGVPVIPGSGLLKDAKSAVLQAKKIGFPVLIKSTGGGGGIGMKICATEQEVMEGFHSCSKIAKQYFGNGDVFVEKYYPSSRHIEIQVFGDGKGKVSHLNERECSIQRRNQKVVEETPSPFLKMNQQLRKSMCEAAVKLSKLVKYRSAGTIEFLVVDEGEKSKETGKFFFLEMNTRLQVEHGITELTTGVDIVEWMIKLGMGLKFSMDNVEAVGHSIECRLYAEKPSSNFQPSSGTLTEVIWPKCDFVRVDSWIRTGNVISTKYDPLLAKIMVVGENRKDAIEKMQRALKETSVRGAPNNLEYLETIISDPRFSSGKTTTKFLKDMDYHPTAIEILDGGLATSIQDYPGRINLRIFGIQPSGPMDDLSFRIANLMLGNPEGTTGLEFTIKGAKMIFHQSRNVAVCGSDFGITMTLPDKTSVEKKKMWSRFFVRRGSILHISSRIGIGARCYLAIQGGIQVPKYLGSESTSGVGYGGYQGRNLRAGDLVSLKKLDAETIKKERKDFLLPEVMRAKMTKKWEVLVLPGPHADPCFTTSDDTEMLFTTDWKVHYHSNRGGIRLIGPSPKWSRKDGGKGGTHPSNIHDVGYALGAINFTGDMPIILTRDGPTQGGFVCPFTIINSDLWKLGQVSPNDTIRFRPVSLKDSLEHFKTKIDYLKQVKVFSVHFPMKVKVVEYPSITQTKSEDVKVKKEEFLNKSIIGSLEKDEKTSRPRVQYRQAGDRYVLVEYGDAEKPLDFIIGARINALQNLLGLITDPKTQKANPVIHGTLDSAPAIRSLIIRYDPFQIPQGTLVDYLMKFEDKIPDYSTLKIKTREIHLPFVFNDRWTQEAVKTYMSVVRKKAVYLPSNVEFIAKNNGLKGIESACAALIKPWIVVGVGFFLGCPFCISLDPRCRLNVPKYNPARTFTPGGAVGIGGSFMAIYPIETAGGYQLYGRTIQTWDTYGAIKPFTKEQPWLLNLFDKLVFHLVSEKKLLEIRNKIKAGSYEYDIRETVFSLKDQLEFEKKVHQEVVEMRKLQESAMEKMRKIEEVLLKEYNESKKSIVDVAQVSEKKLEKGCEEEKSLVSGCVVEVKVKAGDFVKVGDVIALISAMKMEMKIYSQFSGVVSQVLAAKNQQISSGDVVIITKRQPEGKEKED